jgi:hypothetical protein
VRAVLVAWFVGEKRFPASIDKRTKEQARWIEFTRSGQDNSGIREPRPGWPVRPGAASYFLAHPDFTRLRFLIPRLTDLLYS